MSFFQGPGFEVVWPALEGDKARVPGTHLALSQRLSTKGKKTKIYNILVYYSIQVLCPVLGMKCLIWRDVKDPVLIDPSSCSRIARQLREQRRFADLKPMILQYIILHYIILYYIILQYIISHTMVSCSFAHTDLTHLRTHSAQAYTLGFYNNLLGLGAWDGGCV